MSRFKNFAITGSAKAFLITAVIVTLGGGFIWSLYQNNVWSYYLAMQILGWYGFVQAGINIYRWVAKPEDPKAPKSYMDWASEYENN